MTTVTGFKLLSSRIRALNEGDRLLTVTYNELRKIWAEAAQAFVRAAMARVLVDTGMSAATFFPLSRAISRLNLGVPGTPGIVQRAVSRGSGSFRDRPEFPSGARRGRFRNAREGEREGARAFSLTFGSPSRPQFRFFFQTIVFQFAVHEAQRNALRAGEAAFRESLEANIGDVNRVLQLLLSGRAIPRGELQINVRDTLGEAL